MNDHISLDRLSVGDTATVCAMRGDISMAQRLRDIGLSDGTTVGCVMKSPLGDPTAYLIRGAVIALRREDSRNVTVRISDAEAEYEAEE